MTSWNDHREDWREVNDALARIEREISETAGLSGVLRGAPGGYTPDGLPRPSPTTSGYAVANLFAVARTRARARAWAARPWWRTLVERLSAWL